MVSMLIRYARRRSNYSDFSPQNPSDKTGARSEFSGGCKPCP